MVYTDWPCSFPFHDRHEWIDSSHTLMRCTNRHKSIYDTQQPINTTLYSPKSIHKNGLDNYPKARALFDYEAEVHGDLTLRAGDIIYILDRQEEEGWWTGMINQRQGVGIQYWLVVRQVTQD
eukprot:391319_1